MMGEPSLTEQFDLVVIGSGPAGQKAAIQAAKSRARVALIEQEPGVGGQCVYRGTIPSKTLRETALQLARIQRHGEMSGFRLREGVEVKALMSRLNQVIDSHVGYIGGQLARNGITRYHGRGRFLAANRVAVRPVKGPTVELEARSVVVAVGSRPRNPPEIPVDHENILDSDSILSMIYLPGSLTILGGGVIACEYASVFSHLGVKVTMVDRADRPLKFVDADLVERFVTALGRSGGRYVGNTSAGEVRWDGASKVRTRLGNGELVESDKLMVALGRVAAVEGLDLAAAGLQTNARGLLEVDEHCRTKVPGVYAVGDVIGPPSLASTAMEQGRRAARHALQLPSSDSPDTIPIGIYSIPEMASVGLSEEDALRREGAAPLVGRARFEEIARGVISGIEDGLLKLIADPSGRRLLGVHIVGEGASELIHVGQMALLGGLEIDAFVENIFNFPTLGEAYRVAALDLIARRAPQFD